MPNKKMEPILTEILKENQKIIRHLRIGFTRLIILWKISKGPTYGYDLMKTIDEFFKLEIEYGLIKKANSSKIYPILKTFEESGVIVGEWEIKNDKRIKVYNITEKGELALKTLKENVNDMTNGDEWEEFLNDVFNEKILTLKKIK
ncbi:MAG: PadR family transcriptional regulator [Methanobrevibacter sp.]|nr:PadR family transcriptional regulator [Methanobrevibacter sp.]